MNKIQRALRGNPYVSTTVSVLASVLAVSGVVYAATTIGTNVTVDGTLTQTGAIQASSTMLITGAVTHYGNSTFGDAATDVNLFTGTLQASTTALFTTGLLTYGNSTFGDAATDVNLFTGTLQASTTALFTTGLLAYGNSTFGDAATDVNLFTGTLQASTTALFTSGLTAYAASTFNATTTATGLKVGGGGTTFTQLVAGFCNIPDTTVTASSTDYADCAGATGIAVNDRVFVMATSSLAEGLFITAASSTANNTINVRIMNTAPTGAAIATGNISFNFWAFK